MNEKGGENDFWLSTNSCSDLSLVGGVNYCPRGVSQKFFTQRIERALPIVGSQQRDRPERVQGLVQLCVFDQLQKHGVLRTAVFHLGDDRPGPAVHGGHDLGDDVDVTVASGVVSGDDGTPIGGRGLEAYVAVAW